MKKLIVSAVLFAVLFSIAGNIELQAQQVESKHGGIFSEAVANQPSPLLKNKTLLEQRDHGIDLFITGILLSTVVTPLVALTGFVLLVPLAFTFPESGLALYVPGSFAAAAGIIGAVGLGLWIAGAVYWGNGNKLLTGGVVISKREHDTPDVLLALDTEINGLGVAIRY